ncbi:MAG TPA: NAD-dependent epimerase/dehydratase family protein [Gemmatimonadales bacterium]|nr:NAD-dependent epimerase/dehydratase family protein [Gemmatimonadales bacterium]
MTVLVTGGSGLVGSHTIEALRTSGVAVRALVRPGSEPVVQSLDAEVVTGDVADAESWRRAASGGLTGIVHAAATVGPGAAEQAYAVNVRGTQLAIQTARDTHAPLVHVSSVSVYSGSADYRPVVERRTEETPFQPIDRADHYARSKRESEQVLRHVAETETLAAGVTVIRPDVIYGERDRLFAPRIYRSLRTRVLPLVGTGTNHLPCVYAGNVASAIVAALQRPRPGFRAYNVTHDAGAPLTARQFMQAFAEAAGIRIRVLRLPVSLARWLLMIWSGPRLARAALSFMTGEDPYATDLIERELEWRPSVDTRTGIGRTVRWLMGNEKPG